MKKVVLNAFPMSDLHWPEKWDEIHEPFLIEFNFGWNQAVTPAKKFSLEKCDESRDFLSCDAVSPSHGTDETARQERSHLTSFRRGKFLARAAGNQAPFFVNDPVLFQTYTLALDRFTKEVGPRVQQHLKGVILYRGSLSVLFSLVVAQEELTDIEAADVFGGYLHRLASFLNEDLPCYCLFEDVGPFSPGKVAQLLSQERFTHLRLTLNPQEGTQGVLLPPDEWCSPSIIQALDDLLRANPKLRVIPERRLSELWEGLDEIIVFEEALTSYGRRQLRGFEVAGGKIRSRGI